MKIKSNSFIAILILMIMACSSPESEAKKNLADLGISFDRASFLECVAQDNAKGVRLFLKAGMPANGEGGELSPLIEASRRGHTEVAFVLIDSGAEVNSTDSYGVTALMYAAISGSAELMERLITEGAEVNAKDIDGRTALIEALSSENSCPPKTIHSLLEAGADPNVTLYGGSTPLMLAAAGSTEIMEMLIEAGADVNARDERGATALQRARFNPKNIEILKNAGAAE